MPDHPADGPLPLLAGPDSAALEPGTLGTLMASAGVGKTSCLVHLGLDHLVRGSQVLHLALGETLAEVEAAYSIQLDRRTPGDDPLQRAARHADLARKRLIASFPDRFDAAGRLDQALVMAEEGMGMTPRVILLDGFDWDAPRAAVRTQLTSMLELVRQAGASLWMTVTTPRALTGPHPTGMPPACAEFADLIDLAVFLEPLGEHVAMRVLHDQRSTRCVADDVLLDSSEMRPIGTQREGAVRGGAARSDRLILVSGGAPGAEATFGEFAGRWHVTERTYSFPGRELARTSGLVELSEAQLQRGDVSRAWLSARLQRTFSEAPSFAKILQTIWHQVTAAHEVFAVGTIQDDGTVRGGTGLAVELARHWSKPVWVFDLPRDRWFTWDGRRWVEPPAEPTIVGPAFCGTGTRHLDDGGRRAIRRLFQRSFGDPS